MRKRRLLHNGLEAVVGLAEIWQVCAFSMPIGLATTHRTIVIESTNIIIFMKRKLLLVAVALICSVGVWAYTSVVPQVGRTYYLYNMGTGQYWHRASDKYDVVEDIANATPITIESGNKLAYVYEGTTYRIHHDNGTPRPWQTEGVNFTFEGSATGTWGYQLKSKHNDHDRWMCPDGTFQQSGNYKNRDWLFISVYEVSSGTAAECSSTAEASYVTAANGWERVSNNTVLDESVNDYFFAIVCANYPGIMVKMANGDTGQQAEGGYTSSKSMWYSTGTDPISDNNYLWIIEKNNTSGYEGYTFRNTNDPYYTIQAEWGASQYAHTHDQTDVCQWNSYELSQTSGVYTIKTLANGGTNYLGLWTPSNDYTNGQELAGNKGESEKGSFLIYRKAKRYCDMTSRIVNPKAATDTNGWTGFNGGATKRNTNNGFDGVAGFFELCDWYADSWDLTVSQSVNNLPNGYYMVQAAGQLSADATTMTLTANGFSSNFTANGDTNGNILADGTQTVIGKGVAGWRYNSVVAQVTDRTLAISVHGVATAVNRWANFDNVTLTYIGSSLPESLTSVSGKMNADVATAQTNAVNTYESSKTAANLNSALRAIAAAEVSKAAYANAAVYFSNVEALLATTNFYTSAAYSSVYGTYKTAYDAGTLDDATAAGLTYKVASHTPSDQRYTDNTANDLLIPGWTFGGNDASTSGSGFYINSWSTESDGSGDAADFANPFYEYWTDNNAVLSAKTISGTISGLTPNAPYSVTANVRVRQTDDQTKVAGSVTMQVGSGSTVDVTAGKQIGSTPRYIKSYTAVGNADSDGKLTLTFTVAGSSNISWLAFRDVNYTRLADDDDYTALNSAITTAEAKTLGFETGKYAPYNNIAALTALAAAQAINQKADNTQASVNNATTTLSGATWTANAEDVECVYNGDFALADDRGWDRLAWTRSSNWGASIPDNYGSTDISTMQTAGASTGHAYYNQPGSMQYGNTGLYTMPLSANTIYQLSFKYASESENSNESVTASVLNSGDGMAAKVYGANTVAYKTADAFVTKTIKFVTGAAGNYVLTLANSGNTVITDVSITKAANQYLEFADGSVPNYAPGTYPSVKITRTLTANRWATAVYPFAVQKSSDLAIATISEYDKETGELTFDAPDASTANTPFLMRSTAGASEISLSDVTVAAASVTNATASEAHLIGTYSETDITNAEKNYVLSNNVIYPVGEAGATIPAYRAYFQIDQDTEVKALTLVFDDADAIGSIVNSQEPMAESQIYNLAGQRMNKLQRGVNIINGKKVLVK